MKELSTTFGRKCALSLLAAVAIVCCPLTSDGQAQAAPKPQLTNTGQMQTPIYSGHVIGGRSVSTLPAAEVDEIRAAAIAATPTPTNREGITNIGTSEVIESQGHDLTLGGGGGGILYAPSNPDDPEFRAAIAACTGLPCDYFDARDGTPSLALLCTYDAVFTWVNFAYFDEVAFGDVLADYVDAGCGKVILGQWCFDSGQNNSLAGRIMTADYCPVTAAAVSAGEYAGDGADCVHAGLPEVTAYESTYRDECTLRTGAQADGTFTDGFPAVIWRQGRDVYYSPGNTGYNFGTGEWDELICNMVLCVRPGGFLYAPAQDDSPDFRAQLSECLGVPVDYYDARISTPSLALLSNYECVFTWPNFAYDDNVAMGDVLADYVDAGYGTVILGQWCLPTQSFWLDGRIMEPGYCPVDADDDTRELRAYAGDGVTCVHLGPPEVVAYETQFHDDCTLRPNGQSDGTFEDDWLSVAWRPDRRVYYSAGNTGLTFGTGDWAQLVCNMCRCTCVDDTTAPVAALTSPPELGDGCVCDDISINGTAADPDGTFDAYRLDYREVGSAVWNNITTSNVPVVNGQLGIWDTTGLSQGYYNLRLSVRNACGLSNSAVRTVFVDGGYDTLDVVSPDTGDILGGRICFSGTVFESWCGSSYVVEYRPASGGEFQPVDPNNPDYNGTAVNETFATWDTVALNLDDGDYRLRIRATNDCGQTQSEFRQVTVDNTSPVATLSMPMNCGTLEGLVEIRGTAFDANISSWRLQYTGGNTNGWVTLASGNTSVVNGVLHNWDTTNLQPCAYTLRLLVTDQSVLNCGPSRHQSEYLTSVIVGAGFAIPGDLNCDGVVNNFDIDPFVECLTTGDCDCP